MMKHYILHIKTIYYMSKHNEHIDSHVRERKEIVQEVIDRLCDSRRGKLYKLELKRLNEKFELVKEYA